MNGDIMDISWVLVKRLELQKLRIHAIPAVAPESQQGKLRLLKETYARKKGNWLPFISATGIIIMN